MGFLSRFFDVNKFEKLVVPLKNVRVTLLTDFALKLLPVVAGHGLAVHFGVSLRLDPVLQALKVDQTH